jgi:hypothetical protein
MLRPVECNGRDHLAESKCKVIFNVREGDILGRLRNFRKVLSYSVRSFG